MLDKIFYMVIALIIVGAIVLLIVLIIIISLILSRRYKLNFDNHYTPHVNNDFPDVESGNWLPQKHVHDFIYDEKFHYRYGKTFKEKVAMFFCKILALTIIPLIPIFDGGAIYKGKKKLREYNKRFKDGYISVCNHVYEYEFLMIATMNYGKKVNFPIWQEGAEGPKGNYFRGCGAIVLPHSSVKGQFLGFKEIDKAIKEGVWVHIFPEQAGWFYYGGVREFKVGTFNLAYDNNKPIIPFGISFRERKGIWRLFGNKNKPLVTLSVGDPIIPDITKERKEEIKRIRDLSRESVMHLANIKDEEANIKFKSEYSYYPYDPKASSY